MKLLLTVLATSTVLTVDTVDGIPASDQLAVRNTWLGFPGSAYEIVQVTGWVKVGSAYQLTVTRGVGGTTAVPHSTGEPVHLVTEDIVNRIGGGGGTVGPQGPAGSIGPAGPTGPQGATGAASTVPGPTGPQGPAGATGPVGPGFAWRGAWALSGYYYINDVVSWGGSNYVATAEHNNYGTPPTGSSSGPATDPTVVNDGWVVYTLRGLTGPAGPTGADSTVPGPQGATGAQGAASTVPGPQGATGPQGASGAVGPQGPVGANSTVPGPAGATGPQGAQGAQGPAGADSTVAGPTGPQGAAGPAGPQGAIGPQGASGTGTGGATTLDALTDVDTSTTPPADSQFLQYNNTSGLWVPGNLPAAATGAPFDITDSPPNPPPYAGYAYLTSDGKVRIWSGTEWRQALTTLYTPPASGDAAITLASLAARYRAQDLAYADGDSVAVWADTSGNSNNLITHQAGTMVATGIGGLKSVQFSKSTWYELTTPLARPMTMVAVMKNTDTGSGSMVLTSGDANLAYFGLVLGGGWRISDGSSVYVEQAATAVTDPHVFYGSTDATTGIMVGVDGAKTPSAGVVNIIAKYLGYWPAAGGYNMQGLVSEVLIYNGVLNDTQINDIIHQLGLVYGITVSV